MNPLQAEIKMAIVGEQVLQYGIVMMIVSKVIYKEEEMKASTVRGKPVLHQVGKVKKEVSKVTQTRELARTLLNAKTNMGERLVTIQRMMRVTSSTVSMKEKALQIQDTGKVQSNLKLLMTGFVMIDLRI